MSKMVYVRHPEGIEPPQHVWVRESDQSVPSPDEPADYRLDATHPHSPLTNEADVRAWIQSMFHAGTWGRSRISALSDRLDVSIGPSSWETSTQESSQKSSLLKPMTDKCLPWPRSSGYAHWSPMAAVAAAPSLKMGDLEQARAELSSALT